MKQEFTEQNTLGMGVSIDRLKELQTQQTALHTLDMNEENCRNLMENLEEQLILVCEQPPQYYYGCYWYNNGTFPYLPKQDLKYFFFTTGNEEDGIVMFEITDISFEAVQRFRLDLKKGQYIEDPNGDACCWKLIYQLKQISL